MAGKPVLALLAQREKDPLFVKATISSEPAPSESGMSDSGLSDASTLSAGFTRRARRPSRVTFADNLECVKVIDGPDRSLSWPRSMSSCSSCSLSASKQSPATASSVPANLDSFFGSQLLGAAGGICLPHARPDPEQQGARAKAAAQAALRAQFAVSPSSSATPVAHSHARPAASRASAAQAAPPPPAEPDEAQAALQILLRRGGGPAAMPQMLNMFGWPQHTESAPPDNGSWIVKRR